MSDTEELLYFLLTRLRERARREDTTWRVLQDRAETACERVREVCGGDRALRQQVNDLVDADAVLAEYAGEYQFLLGLQMGMELGRINRLGDKGDGFWVQRLFT